MLFTYEFEYCPIPWRFHENEKIKLVFKNQSMSYNEKLVLAIHSIVHPTQTRFFNYCNQERRDVEEQNYLAKIEREPLALWNKDVR